MRCKKAVGIFLPDIRGESSTFTGAALTRSHMKKVFPLISERHKPARVAEQVKGDVRKYLKRERKKKLAEEFDYWDFDCRTGKSANEAVSCHEKEIGKALDAALTGNWTEIYIEILSKQAKRGKEE